VSKNNLQLSRTMIKGDSEKTQKEYLDLRKVKGEQRTIAYFPYTFITGLSKPRGIKQSDEVHT
jgi:hypothetical protein